MRREENNKVMQRGDKERVLWMEDWK